MKAYHSQRIVEERQAEQLARDLPVRTTAPPPPAKQAKPARKGQPLCVECVSHSVSFDWITGRITHRCHEIMTRDPVTGAPTDPLNNRRSAISCAPHGSYWRAKPEGPGRSREIVILPDTEPEEYSPPVRVRLLSAPPRDEMIAVLFERSAT